MTCSSSIEQATMSIMLEQIRSQKDINKKTDLLRQYFNAYPQHQQNPIELAKFLNSQIGPRETDNVFTALAREFRVYLVKEGLVYLPVIPDVDVLEDLLIFHRQDPAYVLSIMARYIRPYPARVSKRFLKFLNDIIFQDPDGTLGLVSQSILEDIEEAIQTQGESVDEDRYKEVMLIEAVETMSHYFSLTRDEKLAWLANWEEHLMSNLAREEKKITICLDV